MKAYILAGGLGTRLYPYSLILPKPLLSIGNDTVIERVLKWLVKGGITDVTISISSKANLYRLLIGDVFMGARLSYDIQPEPAGTAGQLKRAAAGQSSTFVAVYSDSIIDCELSEAIKTHRDKGALCTILAYRYTESSQYGVLEAQKGLLKKWIEKPNESSLIATGAFIFEPSFLRYVPDKGRFGMDQAVNRAVRMKERIAVFDRVKSFTDVGNRRSYLKATKAAVEEMGHIP
jgi:mannose-1-phosphate guanylyltransferase